MAYQNVKTPRMYVDLFSFYNHFDLMELNNLSPIGLNPSSIIEKGSDGEHKVWTEYEFKDAISFTTGENNGSYNLFFAVLGHNAKGKELGLKYFDTNADSGWMYHDEYINCGINNYDTTDYNGWSLVRGSPPETGGVTNIKMLSFRIKDEEGFTAKVGAFAWGTYYTMNAPNLSLTLSREYGSTKEFTTYNGGSMSNTFWNKPPSWGDLGAWELDNGTSTTQALSRSARRSWDLKFSFMGDGDLWGSNQMLSQIREDTSDGTDTGDQDTTGAFKYNLLTDNNFFSQVWHKTLGLSLPMILQQDSSNNNPDQFAIVRGVSNSLKATRSSINTYDISLKLEECW